MDVIINAPTAIAILVAVGIALGYFAYWLNKKKKDK